MRYIFKPEKGDLCVHIHIHSKGEVVVYGELAEKPTTSIFTSIRRKKGKTV